MPAYQLSIAHISDIHCGFGFGGLTTSFKNKIFKRLKSDLKKENPDILIVSGDLTVGASKRQFAKAFEYLKSLKDSINIGWREVFVVPGNHDDSNKLIGGLGVGSGNFRKFNQFFKDKIEIPAKYIGDEGNDNDLFLPIPAEDPKVIFLGLSSLSSGGYARGEVAIESLDWAEKKINDYQKRGIEPFPVVVMHHHPTIVRGVSKSETKCVLKNADVFMNRMSEFPGGSLIILHGHQHSYWEKDILPIEKINRGKIYVISSGSSAGRPLPETLSNQYNIIQLSEQDKGDWKISVFSRLFTEASRNFEPRFKTCHPKNRL